MPLFDRIAPLFLGTIFLGLLWLQYKHPLRRQHFSAPPRVIRHLVFALPAFLILRLALIPIPLAAAWWAQSTSVGILNWLSLPLWLEVLCGILAMDYGYYWWHVATHKVPLLWRFHNVHHSDLDMDVSTATRFHFGELLLSVPFRVLMVTIFGIAPLALIVFEIVFESCGQFHHSNWRLPLWLESTLQRFIVTPRMHGIHHSIVREETDSNWGTIFSLWDKWHRSRRLDIAQEAIVLGVPGYRDEDELTLGDLWKMPFLPRRDWRMPDGNVPDRNNDASP
jgi:sterol desaturase/sphingolipid hydroxylase (fatty acid hydroxylase superfamily)